MMTDREQRRRRRATIAAIAPLAAPREPMTSTDRLIQQQSDAEIEEREDLPIASYASHYS